MRAGGGGSGSSIVIGSICIEIVFGIVIVSVGGSSR